MQHRKNIRILLSSVFIVQDICICWGCDLLCLLVISCQSLVVIPTVVVECCCVCVFAIVGTALLWWKFYEEYEKRQQLHQALNEPADTSVENFSQPSETLNETFFEANETLVETFGEKFNAANEFQIPLLFVSVNSENMFYTLSIVASLFTVRCCYV